MYGSKLVGRYVSRYVGRQVGRYVGRYVFTDGCTMLYQCQFI